MNKLDCPIVRDLLPLYIDQVVSPETAQAVEEHLDGCPDCRREHESLTAHLPIPVEAADTSRQFGDMMKKVKKKETLRILLAVILLVAMMVGGLVCCPRPGDRYCNGADQQRLCCDGYHGSSVEGGILCPL